MKMAMAMKPLGINPRWKARLEAAAPRVNRNESGARPPQSKGRAQPLTPAQTASFWKCFGYTCNTLGLRDKDAREAYRKRVMRETCGKDSMKLLNRTTDFERVMVRFAEDAGDYELAVKFACGGDEKRTAFLIEQCARQVMEIYMAVYNALDWGDSKEYVKDILKQSGINTRCELSGWWMDVSATLARKVLAMLDTHRRRLLRKAGWTGAVAFDPSQRFARDSLTKRVEALRYNPPPPSCFAVKIA